MCAELHRSAEAEPCVSFTHLNRSLSCPPHHRHPWPAPRTGDWAAVIKNPHVIFNKSTISRLFRELWEWFAGVNSQSHSFYMVYKPPIENMRMKQQRTMRRVSLLFFYLKAPHESAFFFILKLLMKVLSGLCLRAAPLPPQHAHTHTHTHFNFCFVFLFISVCFSVLSLIVSVSAFMRTAKAVAACCPNKYWVSVLATV